MEQCGREITRQIFNLWDFQYKCAYHLLFLEFLFVVLMLVVSLGMLPNSSFQNGISMQFFSLSSELMLMKALEIENHGIKESSFIS